MPPWERVKPLAALGMVGAAALVWAFAFRSGWAGGDGVSGWGEGPAETRGKAVVIGNTDVETTDEREKRLDSSKSKSVRDQVGNVKNSLLGDHRKTRGEDIIPETAGPPEDFEYSPREACMQMKLQYPERFGKVDCMSDRYETSDPWWKGGH